MASIVATLPPPSQLGNAQKSYFNSFHQKHPIFSFTITKERKNRVAAIVNAAQESSGSSTSLSVVKSIQTAEKLDLFLCFIPLMLILSSENLLPVCFPMTEFKLFEKMLQARGPVTWDAPEDRLGVIGLGFAAVVAIWASTNFIGVIDKVPLLPNVLELIGILYSSWFVSRYLLFKPGRADLLQIINKSVSDVLGQ